MFRSKVLIFLSCIICCYGALSEAGGYSDRAICEFTENSINYKISLSFTPKNGSKKFNNNTTRNIVFWDPDESTVHLKAREKNKEKNCKLFNNAKEQLYISFGNRNADSRGQMYRLSRAEFKKEGIYTYSEQRSCH